MTAPGYVPNPNYSQDDWDEVCDNPELTDEQLAQARPLAETMPALVEAARRRRDSREPSAKLLLSLSVDQDVVEAFRRTGPGWETRMNDALRRAAGL